MVQFCRRLRYVPAALAAMILALALVACSAGDEEALPASTDRSGAEDDIREAVFRYQSEHNASGQQQTASVYFLATGGPGEDEDPSNEFMTRFEGSTPPVKRVSESTTDPDTGIVSDPDNGLHGLIFSVGNIRWISTDEVEVEGGYYEAGLSASGNVYTVTRVLGEWVVTDDAMQWIS